LRIEFQFGEFQRISDAARRVLELEGRHPLPALFFRIYVDPITGTKSDAEILCRLEYESDKGFYLLTRAMQ
jgi:hypothetical protein